jgi:Flp pilus assembly protein TadD
MSSQVGVAVRDGGWHARSNKDFSRKKVFMKSIKLFSALLLSIAACGSDSRGVDPMSFMPKLPVVEPHSVAQALVVEQPAVVKPAELAMPTKFDDAIEQGKALASKGDNANAKLMFEAAIVLDKKRAEPHMELAKLYISSGERGLAMASANKAVKLAPLSSQAWNTKGRAELNRFAYDDAIEAFTKATELNPDNVWAWNNLGYTELQLKKYDEAAAHLAQATSKQGAAGYMFNNLGTALEHLDRLEEARVAYEGGGKLGSKEASASRKRLEGVKSIAIIDTTDKPDVAHTFDNGEGPSEGPVATPDDMEPADAPKPDAVNTDVPKADAPKGDVGPDAGVPTM